MKKEDKVKILKWYISQKCGLGSIQAEKDNTNDLNMLENILMNDRCYPHHSICNTCWHDKKDYCKECTVCKAGSNYTFPYGYWKKFYERDNGKT